MASSELAKPPMVTLGDLAGFLNSSWLARLWTYQEIMFSGNPILVCGHSLLPWWRFAMSIFFPCITKDLVDEILPANVALFNQLRRWRMLIVDRDEFQNSKNRRHGTIDGSMTDLAHYYNFLFHVALIFEKLSRSLAYDLICLAAGFFPALMAFYFYLDVTDIDTRFFLPLTILAILAKKKIQFLAQQTQPHRPTSTPLCEASQTSARYMATGPDHAQHVTSCCMGTKLQRAQRLQFRYQESHADTFWKHSTTVGLFKSNR
jgi:hypothetical protein